VVTGGHFNNVTIETNQGNIPADAVFRANTLPTISGADGVNNLAGFNGLNGTGAGHPVFPERWSFRCPILQYPHDPSVPG
jgi:hypothetical protein